MMRIKPYTTHLCILALILVNGGVLAADIPALRDLGTYGPTVDVSTFVERWESSQQSNDLQRPVSRAVSVADYFPVNSPSLTPGAVETQAVSLPFLDRPLCVVGVDTRSLAWIKRVKTVLHRTGARCIATNLANASELQVVRAALAPVPVFPASAEDVLLSVGIRHYPVLLSRHQVEQ